MNVLLLVGKTSTSHEAVAADAQELHRQGHHVTLGTRVPPLAVLEAAVDDVVLLDPRLPAPSAATAATPVTSASTPAPAGPASTSAASPGPAVARSGSVSSPESAAIPARAGLGDPLRQAVAVARRRVRRLRGQVSGALTEPARSWRSVRRSPALLQAAARADVVVAVDAPMVRAAWHLGQRLPLPDGPEVVYGLPAAASALARRATRTP